MDILKYKKIHFIGIGGISMSGLAEILLSRGIKITGSDFKQSETTEHMKALGITVYIGHEPTNIEADTELVVYTAAIKNDNKELCEAKKRGIPCIDRAELLGLMMKGYTYPISVSGTHGKTTTTSMLTEIFLAAEKNPTVSLGGVLNSINGNINIGSKDYFIVESCEYCDSFLKFHPYSAIILNIDRDHTDYFETLEQTYKSFKSFAELLPYEGCLVINGEIKALEKVTNGLKCRVVTYGLDKSFDWYAEDIAFDKDGKASYTAFFKGESFLKVSLEVGGMHNVLNSLASIAMAEFYGIDKQKVAKGLKSFKGTHRRFEFKGEFNGVTVIDDYAHHPTEIKSTLSAAKQHNINQLWCVFQPHTYSRTKSLLKEFSEAFDEADNIIILDIYAAREKDTGEVHSKDLVELIKSRGKNVMYFESFENVEKFLVSTCKSQDMLITMGAGDVYLVGEHVLNKNY